MNEPQEKDELKKEQEAKKEGNQCVGGFRRHAQQGGVPQVLLRRLPLRGQKGAVPSHRVVVGSKQNQKAKG